MIQFAFYLLYNSISVLSKGLSLRCHITCHLSQYCGIYLFSFISYNVPQKRTMHYSLFHPKGHFSLPTEDSFWMKRTVVVRF